MAEKSEKATPKKLRDARKKGQVAKSQDFPAAFTFLVSIAATLGLAGSLYAQMSGYLKTSFKAVVEKQNYIPTLIGLMGEGLKVSLWTSLPILLATVFVGVLANVMITGPLFALEAMKPDLKKLNPIENIKAKFKLKTLVELVKQILKITGAIIIIYVTVYSDLGNLIYAAAMPLLGSTLLFNYFLVKVMIRIAIFFLAIALFDVIYQKINFAKEMKMEKFEVKQEYKDTEGDPMIKGRRRQIGHEIAYSEGPTSSVKKARGVVTNPTHLAIAFEYNPETQPAPLILVKGSGKIADIIIREAERYNVPIVRDVPLARLLHEKGRAGQYVPKEAYEAIAEVIRWIIALEQEEGV